jgi:hypothetical protein
MVDRNANRALISAYCNCIRHYQRLLKTHLTEVEQDYIKERLSACNAALKALIESEITIWEPVEFRKGQTRLPCVGLLEISRYSTSVWGHLSCFVDKRIGVAAVFASIASRNTRTPL